MKRILLITLLMLLPAMLPCGLLAGGFPHGEGLPDFEMLSPSEEGLVRIEVSGIAASDFLARFVGDTLFVPFTPLCDFLRIRSEVSADLTTFQALIPGADTVEISRITNMAHMSRSDIAIPGPSIRVVEGQIYLEQSVVANLLGLTAFYDAPNLKLRIAPDEKLPLVLWHRTQGKYGSLAMGSQLGTEAAPEVDIDRQLFSGVSLNWTLSNNLNSGNSHSAVGLFSFGQQLLYGTLQLDAIASLNSGMGNRPNVKIEGASWMFQAPGSSLISRLRLGTFLLNHRRMHGVEITNAPLTPRTGYSTYTITGQTQPSWTVELYDGNKLVDVTRADSTGRYNFAVPLGYGTVDRMTRAVGPYGETEFQRHRAQLDQGMIPAGEIDYAIEAGVDSLTSTTAGEGKANLRLGVIDNLTIGGTLNYRSHSFDQFNRDSLSPSAFATVWLGGSTTLNASYQVRSRLVGGSFYTLLANNAMLHLTLDSLSPAQKTYVAGMGISLPIGPISIGGSGRYERLQGRDAYVMEPQLSGHISGIGFIGSTRLSWNNANTIGEHMPVDSVMARGGEVISTLQLTAAPIAGIFLMGQGQYDHTTRSITGLFFSTYYRVSRHIGLNLGYSIPGLNWDRGIIQAQVAFDLRPFRASSLTTYSQGKASVSTLAQGSALISQRGLTLFSETAVGQSAILLEAFHDRNQDGVRDPGEESMEAPVAWLDIGGSEMTADDGMFRALPANRQCRLNIDRWSYGSEELYPSRAQFDIYTLPSGVQVIEIPVAAGVDMTGTCLVENAEGKPEPPAFVNGLRVQLISERNNATYEGEVFSDGTVFVPGVSTGEYRMTFDQDQLASRRLCPPASSLPIQVTQGNDRLPSITFKRCVR